MIRGVFFDLDDTLCDATPAFAAGRAAAFDAALAAMPSLSREALTAAWSRAHAELMPQLEAGAVTMAAVRAERFQRTLTLAGAPDGPVTAALAAQMDQLLGETQLAHLRRFDDVAALAALRERGLTLGVITNGAADDHPDSQRSKIERLALADEVDGVWISDATGYRKPHPRAFAPALAASGFAADECLYVGDSLANDVAGANAAGIRSVWLARDGVSAVVPSKEASPWRMTRTLFEVLDLLGQV